MKSSTNKLRAPIAAFGASTRNDTPANDELIGVKGQKYGLQVRGGAASGTTVAKKAATRAAALPIFAAAANEANRDSDTDEKRKRLLAAGDSQKKKHAKEAADLLVANPEVFAYDELYDDIQKTRQSGYDAKLASKRDTRPKYIQDLLDKSVDRKMEQDIIWERKLLKDRVKDDHMYGDKEMFVTDAYKDTLRERAAWKTQQDKTDAKDAAKDVTKREGTAAFMSHLLNSDQLSRSSLTIEKKKEEEEKKRIADEERDEAKRRHQLADMETKRAARLARQAAENAALGIVPIATTESNNNVSANANNTSDSHDNNTSHAHAAATTSSVASSSVAATSVSANDDVALPSRVATDDINEDTEDDHAATAATRRSDNTNNNDDNGNGVIGSKRKADDQLHVTESAEKKSRPSFDPIADARESAARRARDEAAAVAAARARDAVIKKEVDQRAISARERYLARKAATKK